MSEAIVWSAVTITDKVMQDRPCPDYFVAEGDYDALREDVARLRVAIEVFLMGIPKFSKKKLHGLQGEYWSPAGMMVDTEIIAKLQAALTATSQPVLPYKEWCRHPEKCAGLASCPQDPTCAD